MDNAVQPNVEDVKKGQKLVIYAFLVGIATGLLSLLVGEIALLVQIASIIMSIFGLMKVGKGLHYSITKRVLVLFLMLIPVVSLITLLVINSRATAVLRQAGLKVGLLGAS